MADKPNSGAFVPTTNVWDVSEIYSVDVTSDAFKELLVRLYQNINNISLSLNLRDAGYYVQEEFVNGQLFFPDPTLDSTTPQTPTFRNVVRKAINFGTLPNTATKSVAHGIDITTNFSFTRIYGVASNTTGLTYLPLPFAAQTDSENIELDVDSTNVNITTGLDYSAYDTTYVILEFLKN